MDASEFLKEQGAYGYLIATNGPRLYVHRAPGVDFMPGRMGHQAAYIDLTDWTVHCRTFSNVLSAAQCKAESDRVLKQLAPLARAAKARHLDPRGRTTTYTQAAIIQSRLQSAGCEASRTLKAVVIDPHKVGREAGISDAEARGYQLTIQPLRGNEWWWLSHKSEADLLNTLKGDPMRSTQVVVQPLVSGDLETQRLIRHALLRTCKIAGAYTKPVPRSHRMVEP